MGAPGVIAVTGLKSFIGSGLVRRLHARNAPPRVVGIDHRRPFRLDERVRFHRIDLTDPDAGALLAELLRREVGGRTTYSCPQHQV